MREQKTTIQINGKIYDTSDNRPNFRHHAVVHRPSSASDGMVSSQAHAAPVHHTPKLHPAISRTPAAHHPKQMQKAKTLMRHSVKKPSPKTFAPRTVEAPLNDQVPVVIERIDTFSEQVSAQRLNRAQHVHMSRLISRFGAPIKNVSVRTEPIAVRPAPLELPASPIYEANVRRQASRQTHHTQRHDPVRSGLQAATSHTQHHVEHRKVRLHHKIAHKFGVHHRVVSGGAAVFLVLIIGSYVAYQNVPNFAMKVAAARAGVNASIPGYKPSGFAMAGPVKYEPGKVTLAFQSGQDERNFNVTQQTSNWNSETLRTAFVEPLDQPFQTYLDNGRTIFIYGSSNATWVDGGVWYQIEGNANLNSDQLIRIASSL